MKYLMLILFFFLINSISFAQGKEIRTEIAEIYINKIGTSGKILLSENDRSFFKKKIKLTVDSVLVVNEIAEYSMNKENFKKSGMIIEVYLSDKKNIVYVFRPLNQLILLNRYLNYKADIYAIVDLATKIVRVKEIKN